MIRLTIYGYFINDMAASGLEEQGIGTEGVRDGNTPTFPPSSSLAVRNETQVVGVVWLAPSHTMERTESCRTALCRLRCGPVGAGSHTCRVAQRKTPLEMDSCARNQQQWDKVSSTVRGLFCECRTADSHGGEKAPLRAVIEES